MSEDMFDGRTEVPSPEGYRYGGRCPECGSADIVAVEAPDGDADEHDPDMVCRECGNRW